jgi:aspartyl-tRNA(Asn)/glutamyl-tRNA(Gln) amidotransferase subunit A
VTGDDVRVLIDDPACRAEVSAAELAEALLTRLETRADLHAMITLTPELALAQAHAADAARARGRALPLDGMPLVIKDNVGIAGVPTTVGSRLFADRVASSDAEVTTRIRVAGGVILGKANLHELAFGATSANEMFGAVVNPAASDRIPGGSSGGSGAAVAADLCVAAIGTDTGGSVRLPASLCGVSGLRPTFGAVSNRGVQPVSSSLDTVGPLARSVTDVHALLASIAGFDSRDPSSCGRVLDLTLNDSVKGLRVGVVESLVERSDPDIAAAVRAVAAVLSEGGAHLSPIEIDGWQHAVDACGLLIKAEALGVYREAVTETPELFEEGTRRRLALAADVDADALRDLRLEQSRFAETVELTLAGVDLLLLPTIPVDAPPAGGADTVDTTAAVVPYTHLLSFAHVPALSIPCGVTSTGGPVGAQLAAARWHDGLVIRAGAALQAVTDWHRARPAFG